MTNNINSELKIRRATIEDVSALGKLGSKLALQHIGYDKSRFTPVEPLEESHTAFFAGEIKNEKTVILILELDGEIAGYAFLRFEPASFVELIAAGAWLHDIYLTEAARGKGAGSLFFDEIIIEARKMNSKSLMLSVSPHNTTARKFFEQYGFRPTMQEMRLDFKPDEEKL